MKQYILEFKNYLEDLNSQLLINNEAKKGYYGFYLFDGKIIESPDILFIGINPGRGNDERKYNVSVNEGVRLSYLDKFDGDYNYHLANNIVNYLEEANMEIDAIQKLFNERSVKMNMYSIITESESDIKRTIQILGKDVWDDFYKKSMDFIFRVIKDIKPKIVFLEGKSVYYEVVEGCMGINNTWTKEGNYSFYESGELETVFISISRGRDGGSNKVVVGNKLKEYL